MIKLVWDKNFQKKIRKYSAKHPEKEGKIRDKLKLFGCYSRIISPLLIVIGMLMAINIGSALAQPGIPKEEIPADISPKIKELIGRLYFIKARDRVFAVRALRIFGKRSLPALPFIISILRDEDWMVRKEAAWTLGNLGDPRAVEPLISLLSDNNRYVTDEADEALEKIGAPAVKPLISALKSHSSSIRQNAAKVLGNIGGHKAIAPLMSMLSDQDLLVAEQVARALGRIGEPAVKQLISSLIHENSENRENAAWALGKIGSKEAIKPLAAALGDKDLWLRENAAVALGEIRNPEAVEPLIKALEEKDPVVRERISEALAKITGHNYYGDDPAVWQKWWDQNRQNFSKKP